MTFSPVEPDSPLRRRSANDPREQFLSFPVSFAQQRLWFLNYLEPGVAFYNVPIPLRLTGPLDIGALEDSLNEIVRRHDSLRTSFPVHEGQPVQVIAPARHVALPETDLRNIPSAAREQEAARQAGLEAVRPFDLAQGPLLRAKLLRLADDDHVLVVTMHHIVSDGWSVNVFLRELTVLYEAFRLGSPSPLPELPIQYADYALWQRNWLRGEVLAQQLDFWKRQLAGIPALLELPTDRPRPATQSFRGASISATVRHDLLRGLNALSRSEGATLFMTLLAAFYALLSRHTGQEDILVGSPIAGRTQVETEGLIGFFVNTLVLRGDLSGDPTFRQLIARVREAALAAYAHQDLPFEKLVEELQPERDLSRNPLFQVMFALQNAPSAPTDLAGLKVISQPLETRSTHFDIELHLSEKPTGLACSLVYATDLFDSGTIARMLSHYQALLEAVVRAPDRKLSELPMLTTEERRQVLVDWNETRGEYPRDKTVHELFEAQVDRAPASEAVVFGGKRLTYGQLNEKANRLAAYLRHRGVGPEVPVALSVERSLEMAVGLLGILKAGGAYVALDPSYPRQRLAFMLEDTATPVVLTQESLAESLPEGPFEVVRLDADWPEIAREDDENPARQASPENLAYVIYTSGSTGTPKGVAMPHRSLVNLIHWQIATARRPSARTLQFASLNFDVSFQEMFSTWCAGGTLVLVSDEVRRDAAALWRMLSTESVERILLPFIALQQLAEAAERDGSDAPALADVLTAGEQLQVTPQIASLFRSSDRRLENQYGPSESHVVTAHTLTGPAEVWPRLPPIGRPIANTQIYLLDRHRQPVPIGVIGELYIGGVGVARGYWRRPELTAEKFVEDPFSGEPNARLYRTGDLARFRADGEIEFLGRVDHQVKIRGYRVELGEVESVLASHPDVLACAVATRQGESEGKRLIGYVVAREGASPSVTQLRGFLKSTLPDYMVPPAFVFLDALPTTPSGKVDWKTLLQRSVEHTEVGASEFLPQDTLELVLLKIWEDVLGVRSLGVRDNFFELGGHSLLAVRLFADIEKAFGRTLPLATLFQAPTVEGLAAKLREEGWEAPWSSLVVIQGGVGRPPFLCVPGVGGNILGFYDLAQYLGLDQPVYGLQAQGLDGKREPFTRIEEMAAHYIKEIKTVLPDGPFLLGGASFGGSVAYEMARQLEREGRPVALVALFDAFAPGSAGSSPSPFSEVMRRRLKRSWVRIQFHGKNLLFGSERSSYIVRKSRTLRRRIRSRIWQMIYRSYRSQSKPLPRVFQDVREAGYLAIREYVPGTYGGRVTLFRAQVRSVADTWSRDLGWKRLALGGVDIQEVPGDHVDMLLRPNVKLLSGPLRDCIDKAIGKQPEASSEETKHPVPAHGA